MANFGGGNSLLITLEDTPYNALTLHHHGLNIDARFDAVGTFAVPGPVAGALVPGLVSAMGLLGFSFFRRRRQSDDVPQWLRRLKCRLLHRRHWMRWPVFKGSITYCPRCDQSWGL